MFKNYIYAAMAGLAIGFFTIYIFPTEFELFLWPVLIVAIVYFTAMTQKTSPFWAGFWYALVVAVSITITHLILIKDYLLSHPEEKQRINNYDPDLAPQLALLMVAPVYWLIFGALSGLLAILWTKVQKDN